MLNVVEGAFSYTKEEGQVFSAVNFSAKRGEVVALLGPNGCGKSTLLGCIAGIQPFAKGYAEIEGKRLSSLSSKKAAMLVGYVPQIHIPAFSYTVREFVVMGRAPHIPFFRQPSKKDYEVADEAIERMNLGHLKDSPYDQLSGGERQQVLFARTLAQKPSVILLDEPASNLDFGNQQKVLKIIRELAGSGYTILMATHFPDHSMMVADKVLLMKNRTIIKQGEPGEVLTSENLSELYGIDVIVTKVEKANRLVCIPL